MKIESIQYFNSIDLLVSDILIILLISICKFENVSCALGLEVKRSKFFCRSFRTCITILSMNFVINKLFWRYSLFKKIYIFLIFNSYKSDFGQNNVFIVKSIGLLKIIIHVMKLLQKYVECFISKPNMHGTFCNLHIETN